MGESVLGVDFSGAKNAGDSIWLAKGTLHGGELAVTELISAGSEWGKSREVALKGLVTEITDERYDIVGLDFPFGVPSSVVDYEDWYSFVNDIGSLAAPAGEDTYPPEAFQEHCLEDAGGEYRKRGTDEKHGGQCPYGVRIRSQTFYGIRDVLQKLIQKEIAIHPMAPDEDGEGNVVEVYPAATVREVLDEDWTGYKGATKDARDNRRNLVESVESLDQGSPSVTFEDDDEIDGPKFNAICNDDALDSVIAALSAARALDRSFETDETRSWDKFEGHIYV